MNTAANVLPFRRPGDDSSRACVGLWLYVQHPAGSPDAVVLTRRTVDAWGTYWIGLTDGGAGPETRFPEHALAHTRLSALRVGNYLEQVGYLETVLPDEDRRAAFVNACRQRPAEREEAARLAAEESARVDREVGPWFRDVEDGLTGGTGDRIPDTVEAKVIRRFLASVGVKATVRVRRYSMASGLDFGPGYAGEWTDADAEVIARVFPGEASRRSVYDRDTGENVERWSVSRSLYPHKRADASDLMSDYHDPGGFRVAPEYVLAVSLLLSEELEKLAAKGVR